ncbi:MAG: radical SAM protein [Desulfofustis sp.]|nr:radical SAM protein [Desulfofustis sp.]MBT8345075.1 radical SAM protein [Desulfofustis sp.]NNK57318.1 radical SAM protein [Desulfofustis sp.]
MQTKGLRLFHSGILAKRVERAHDALSDCTLCPRNCRVNRLEGETGRCGTAEKAVIASYNPHFGEEQPLVGSHGSGTIFHSGCSLGCCFCQNYDISHHPSAGSQVDAEHFAAIMLDLQSRGCHNINFVTPSHVVPQIMAALITAYENGLTLPLVYNSSGYDSIATLDLLDGVIDIYMPDFKFWENETGRKYADAPDYPEVSQKAVREMHRQVGDLQIDQDGVAQQGLLIRHLLMPGGLEETKAILGFIARNISTDTYVNVMDQYRPCGTPDSFAELQSTISHEHYSEALDHAQEVGLKRLDQRDLVSLLKRLGISY